MAAIVRYASHPGGKTLRTGDKVKIFGFDAEFVCRYRGQNIFYFEDAACVESLEDMSKVLVYDARKPEDIAGKLFETV